MNNLRAATVEQPTWSTHEPVELGEASWRALMRNEIPLVVIRDFASQLECARLGESAQRLGFAKYDFVEPPIDRIGVTVFEYDKKETIGYFEEAERMRAVQREIFAGAFDPIARLREKLGAGIGLPVGIARDAQLGQYFAGLVRRIENGTLLHIDYAPAEQPKWNVARIEHQFAWNLYIELDAQRPGKTHIYNKPWLPEHEALKIPDSYGYQHALVAGVERCTFQPTLGDVYIFNTRNFHEVDSCNARRTTVTSAGGIMPDGETLIWS